MIRFIWLLSIALIMGVQSVYAQTQQKKPWYKVWVYAPEEQMIAKGYLFQVMDTSIIVAQNKLMWAESLIEIPISRIDLLEVRQAGSVGGAVLGGCLAGFFIGGVVASGSGDGGTYSSGGGGFYGLSSAFAEAERALTGASIGMIGGGIAFGLLGSRKKSRMIQGDLEVYRKWKVKLEKYARMN